MIPQTAKADPLDPVSTADPKATDVEQMRQIVQNLGDHLRPNNPDTRFIVDRSLPVFRTLNNIGLISFPPAPAHPNTIQGSAIILNGCFALTSYHGVEDLDIWDFSHNLNRNKRIYFSYGSVDHQVGVFKYREIKSNAVDPGILNLRNRRFNDDMILIKFNRKLERGSYENMALGSAFGRALENSFQPAIRKQFMITAGFPISKVVEAHQFNLYADFTRIRGNAPKWDFRRMR